MGDIEHTGRFAEKPLQSMCELDHSQTGQFAEIFTHNWMKIEIRNHPKHNIKVHKMCIFQSIP